ncbi:MAG: hypothetical protein ACOYXU_05690 [Nitrospirota bacterium]
MLKHANSGLEQRQIAFAELDTLVRKLNELPKTFPSLPDRFYSKAQTDLSAQDPTRGAQQDVADLAA